MRVRVRVKENLEGNLSCVDHAATTISNQTCLLVLSFVTQGEPCTQSGCYTVLQYLGITEKVISD